MDLAKLISELRTKGNIMASWSGVETNVESVSNIIGSNQSGKFSVELKLKAEPINEEELYRLAEEYCPTDPKYIEADSLEVQNAFVAGYRKAKGE